MKILILTIFLLLNCINAIPAAHKKSEFEQNTKFTIVVQMITNIFNALNGSNSSKDITSFSFDSTTTKLNKNYTGTISGNSITVQLPYAQIDSAIATFQTSGATVSIGTERQTSGTTSNNFSSPVTYIVTAEDKTTKSYTVTVTGIGYNEDTGQTLCYNDGGSNIACGQTLYPLQDADIASISTNKSFSVTINTGFTSDYIVIDNVTGLIWNMCLSGLSGSTCGVGSASILTYANAITTCTSLNSGSGFAGIKTWRLPEINELVNLIYFQMTTSPSTDQNVFANSAGSGALWSNTAQIGTPANAYNLFLGLPASNAAGPKTASYNVRCVSGKKNNTKSLTDNGNGSITDNLTGLVWYKCASGLSGSNCTTGTVDSAQWQSSLTTCYSSTFLGKTWRLPNVLEYLTVLDYSASSNAMNSTYFPNPQNNVWSSTTNPTTNTQGYTVATNGYIINGGANKLAGAGLYCVQQ